MGGQAVIEGVMMRGATTWAVAVRTPDGDIDVAVHDVPGWAERYNKIPLVRGVMNLAESMSLGMRALSWSANLQMPEEERLSKKAMGGAMAVSLVLFMAIFILLPALGARGLGSLFGITGLAFHALEGALVLSLFLGYLTAIGQMKEIRKVFQYHGAEHKSIAAYENDVPLTPESAQTFTTAHVRCGTNFLLIVLTMAIVVYSIIGRPALPYLILSRVILIPVIAGLAYEVIRYAARHMDKRWVRVLMIPGLNLQKLTTREPTLEQIEVAIAALRAVFTSEQSTEVDARVAA
ncbi:MAG: DUF1385 domain-containing protein [Acidimicrobiia bacterium]